jgi:hypothetical protein
VGRIKDLTGSYTGGLLTLSAAGLVAMIIVLVFPHQDLVEHVPDTATPSESASTRSLASRTQPDTAREDLP